MSVGVKEVERRPDRILRRLLREQMGANGAKRLNGKAIMEKMVRQGSQG